MRDSGMEVSSHTFIRGAGWVGQGELCDLSVLEAFERGRRVWKGHARRPPKMGEGEQGERKLSVYDPVGSL